METKEIEFLIISISIISLIIVIAFILFFLVAKNRNRKSLIEVLQLKEEMLKTQLEIQEQTLQNISQELHDNLGQSLTVARLNLNALAKYENPAAAGKVEATKTIIGNSLTTIRNLAKSMLGEKIAEIGIETALVNELNLLAQTDKYQIKINSVGEPFLLSPQQEIVAFRILQEALHNTIKHAEATVITVDFDYKEPRLTVILKDNGKGFDSAVLLAGDTGVGLKNIKNRAKLIAADLDIVSLPNQGTTLNLTLVKS